MSMHPTILIVDDDIAVRRGLQLRMSAAGYDSILCHDGDSGLAAAQDRVPAVVLLDGKLPDMDGVEFIRNLHRMMTPVRVPVVVVSGAEEKRKPSLDAGATVFLLKPYNRDSLLAAVRSAIDGASAVSAFSDSALQHS